MAQNELNKPSSYWDKRRLKNFKANEKYTKEYIKRVKKIYSKSYREVQDMIDDVYRNYSNDTGIDVQKLKEILSKSESEKLFKELKKQGLDKYVKDNYKSRISRLEQVQAQIYAKAKEIYPKEELEQEMCYKGVINNSYYKTIYDVEQNTGMEYAFSKIDDNMMNAVLSERWSGKNYSERIWTNTDILANSLSDIVGSALMSGQGVEKTARQLRERFNVGKYYAERLIRTEMAYYDNQADMMAYEELGIEEYVLVATLDSRTSQYCIDMDGQHRPYSEIKVGQNFPPFHPNCRCTTRGYLGEEAEKLMKRNAVVDGRRETISNISYKEWKKGIETLKNNPKSGIIDIHIDEFTNCLRRTKDGELVDTYFKQVENKKLPTQKDGWKFNWKKHDVVYGLYTKDNNQLQGLLNFIDMKENNAIKVNLVENNPINRKNKDYLGVGGHLFAEACRISKEKGYGGFIYFDAKTNLIDYYERELGAKLISDQRMFIDEVNAKKLVEKYYGKKK